MGNDVLPRNVARDWWLVLDFGLPPFLGGLGVWRYGAAGGWTTAGSAIDPLHWKVEHQLALAVAGVIGALAGLFYALSRTQNSGGSLPSHFVALVAKHRLVSTRMTSLGKIFLSSFTMMIRAKSKEHFYAVERILIINPSSIGSSVKKVSFAGLKVTFASFSMSKPVSSAKSN